jgi:hypothetical protein
MILDCIDTPQSLPTGPGPALSIDRGRGRQAQSPFVVRNALYEYSLGSDQESARSALQKLTDHTLNLAKDEKRRSSHWDKIPKILYRELFSRIQLSAEGPD